MLKGSAQFHKSSLQIGCFLAFSCLDIDISIEYFVAIILIMLVLFKANFCTTCFSSGRLFVRAIIFETFYLEKWIKLLKPKGLETPSALVFATSPQYFAASPFVSR